jgi:hypothetical protein
MSLAMLTLATLAVVVAGYGGPASGLSARQPTAAARWIEQMQYPASIGQLGSMSCLTATNCVAVGSSGNQAENVVVAVIATTSDGGRSWVSRPLPRPVAGLDEVSCTPSGQCLAVGGTTGTGGKPINPNQAGVALSSSDAGRTWTSAAVPAGVGVLGSVSCPTPSFCLAVGGTPDNTGAVALTTTTSGQSWEKLQVPFDVRLWQVSCPSSTVCLGFGATQTNSQTTPTKTGWYSAP